MEFFDQFSDTLISTGKMVGEKAKDIADVTKLSDPCARAGDP